jgi:hypothetical protein
MVASSMGQGPSAYQPISKYLVLRDASRLLDALGCRSAEVGLAMYPAYSLRFRSDIEAESARSRIRALRLDGQPCSSISAEPARRYGLISSPRQIWK